ncbi:benzoyl-CoA oxygenase component B, partial [Daphnia pulex]
FFVQKNTRFSDNNIPIPFDVAQVNVGNAMDLSSGVFTARRPGIYFFSFTTLAYFPASSDYTHLGIFLHHNNDRIAFGSVEEASPAYHMGQLSVQSTLSLKPGDRVWVQIYAMAPGVYLYDNQNHNIFFTGFMLEEEIVASL